LNLPEIQIVDVSLNDLAVLQEISRRTFAQSFAALNTPENMKYFLDHHYSNEKLSSEIQNPESWFFFAINRKNVIGYLKLNRGGAQTVLPNDRGLEIERIYVDEAYKGKGIGGNFIDKAVETARNLKAKYIWLGVWEHNMRAIHFYEKNGFSSIGNHIFKLGEDEQTDLLLKRVLDE
jgi:ribosomal protein S18 acetylase RimI-like enzyme